MSSSVDNETNGTLITHPAPVLFILSIALQRAAPLSFSLLWDQRLCNKNMATVRMDLLKSRFILLAERISPVLLLTGADGIARVFSFVAMLVMVDRLGSEGFGIVSLAWSMMAIASIVAKFQLEVPLLSLVAKDPSQAPPTMGAFLLLRIFLWMFVGSLLFTGLLIFHPSSNLCSLLCCCSIALLFQNLSFMEALKGFYRFIEAAMITVTGALCNMLVIILFLRSAQDILIVGASTVLTAFGVSAAAYLSLPSGIEHPSFEKLKLRGLVLLRQGFPLVLAAAVMILQSNIDALLLGCFRSLRELGEYRVACRFSEALIAIVTPVGTLALAVFSKSVGSRQRLDVLLTSFVKTALAIMAAGIGGLLVGGFSLLQRQFLHEYANLPVYWNILLAGVVFRSICIIMNSYLIALNAQRTILLVSVVVCGLNMVMNYFLIPRYGALAASVMYTVTFFLELLLYGWFLRNEFQCSLLAASAIKVIVKSIAMISIVLTIRCWIIEPLSWLMPLVQDLVCIILLLLLCIASFRKEYFEQGLFRHRVPLQEGSV